MAEDFNASLVISTSDAVNNVRNLDSASKDLDKTLAHLHTTMGNSQGDIDKVAKSLKIFTDTQRQSNRDQKDRNATLISGAKLEREQIVNRGKSAEVTQKQAMAEAKLQGLRSRDGRASATALGSVTRKNAESDARIANMGILTTARATTESERLAAAQQRTAGATAQRSAAEDRASTTALRLANAQSRAQNSTLALNDSLSNSRYLLYDVGATYTAISIALLAIPAATTAVAASYEKDFAQVIRTTGLAKDEAGILFQELRNMSTQIPLSFGELANIAAIAGQLGVAKNEVAAFTDTVAKFGAASNVGISEAATAFGRLEQSFNPDKSIPDFYNKIGSAIALVGVNSAASETEIVAVTNQISAAGAQFGFTADQIVGMSGALASVRIRPELARGAFQRILLQLSRAADQGSESFDKFAKYTEVSGQAAVDLFKNDPSAFFNQYITGIKGTISSGASVSAVLDDIGAKNVFDKQFILGLANGLGVYNKALSDSATAFEEGTFLNESTAGIFETFSATIDKLGNAFANLTQNLGGGGLKVLTPLADTVLNLVSAFDRLLNQVPGFRFAINALLGLGAVVGVFLAFKSAQAFVLAGLVGLQQVMGKASIAGALSLRGNMYELAKTMLMARGASAELAVSLLAGKSSMQQMALATTATSASVARLAATNGTAAASTTALTTRTVAATGAMAGFARASLGLVGGPLGVLVIALGAVATGMISAREEAVQAGDAIATAMKNGADAANAAAAQQLTNRKVGGFDGASGFSDVGKSATEMARTAGVAFDKVIAGVTGGAEGAAAFRAELDRVAKSNGLKSVDEAINNPAPGTLGAKLQFLNKVVSDMNGTTAEATANQSDATAATDKLAGAAGRAAPSVDGLKEGMEGVGAGAETAADQIKAAVDAIFGLVDAQAATDGSLSKLGAGLQDSLDFGTGTDGGRNNLSNFQDTIRNAAMEQQQLMDETGKDARAAAADYAAFIDGLMAEIASKGADVAQIQALAQQAKGIFGTTFASGDQPTITPTVEAGPVLTEVALTKDNVQQLISTNKPTFFIDANTDTALGQVSSLATAMAEITGYPYEVVLDALTDPAAEKSEELYGLFMSITNGTYVAPVGADTSSAIANVQSFSAYARQELANLQTAYNNVLAMSQNAKGFLRGAANDVLGKGWDGAGAQTYFGPQPDASRAVAPQVRAATAAAPPIAQPNFGALNNGYDGAAKAAKGAGDAGKQAGKDMADGIDEATKAAEDYGNRLKTALTSSFNQQYGMQKATDDYQSALNAIAKKREDELSQMDDLISKQKELNNSRKEDLTTARKAGIEKAISQKYGEVDRALDYEGQEQSALDSAAAKQKDIDANTKTYNSLKEGIDNFDGNTDAAIANREALRGLESKMLDMVSAYAATGASQEQVRAYAQKLTAQFQTDAGQVFQNRAAVSGLIGDMGRYIGVINSVPRTKPTTVTANTGGALSGIGAVGNALSGLRDRTVTVRVRGTVYETPRRTSDNQIIYGVTDSVTGRPNGTFLFNKGGEVPGFAGGGMVPGQSPSNPNVDNKFATVDGKGMIKVRSGEFIVQQPAVDYWGLDFFKNLNNMKMPAFNGGGFVGNGSGSGSGAGGPVLVELTAENIAAIQRLPQINLYADSTQLATTVNQGNTILASQGAN